MFLGRDINAESLYYTYQSVYFILFFSLTWVLLFLIWLARIIYMLQFRKDNTD